MFKKKFRIFIFVISSITYYYVLSLFVAVLGSRSRAGFCPGFK